MKFLYTSLLIFGIAFAGHTSAQTTVCSRDTVVLVLNGYQHGSTLWLESSDLITWSKASGTSYNDSLVIAATTTLYYRAKIIDGTCDRVNSDTVMIVVRPILPPPTAKPASGIAPISFDANWFASGGATIYYLDVATDTGFTSFFPGYENLNVHNKTTYDVTGVLYNTTYYYRVRAYDDSCGRVSGNSNTVMATTLSKPAECTVISTCNGNITDIRDNQIYKTVQIGSQCWMAQNLNAGNRIDGIKPQTPGVNNQNADIEKYCYGDKTDSCTKYGGLYQWEEMMAYGTNVTDPKGQGICPTGWHIPTENEWTCLEKTLGETTAGGKLKDTTLWQSPNTGANNNSGFSARPSGYQYQYPKGHFANVGMMAQFWSATEYDATTAWSYYLFNNNAEVIAAMVEKTIIGLSVRCVKD